MLDKEDIRKIDSLLDKRFSSFKNEMGDIFDLKLKPIKSDVAEIRREVKQVVYVFDHEYLGLRSRVERIEEILNLKLEKK